LNLGASRHPVGTQNARARASGMLLAIRATELAEVQHHGAVPELSVPSTHVGVGQEIQNCARITVLPAACASLRVGRKRLLIIQ